MEARERYLAAKARLPEPDAEDAEGQP